MVLAMNRGNIRLVHGDILAAEAEALVNPVNCVGVMGKGLALQFKRAFPENYIAYYKACKEGLVKPGTVFVYSDPMHMLPHHIINFPTKRHWRDKSHMGDIALGLVSLVSEVRRLNIMSIAIPPLGCGLGGLQWGEVLPCIQKTFTNAELPTRVDIYEATQASQQHRLSAD